MDDSAKYCRIYVIPFKIVPDIMMPEKRNAVIPEMYSVVIDEPMHTSPEVYNFIRRCIGAALRIQVEQISSASQSYYSSVGFPNLASKYRGRGKEIRMGEIAKVLQETLQEMRIRATKISRDGKGIVIDTELRRLDSVPQAFQGADIRWRIHVVAKSITSPQSGEEVLDYDCVLEVFSKPRSAAPNRYKKIAIPAASISYCEGVGKPSGIPLETITAAFERRVYNILSGKKEDQSK
jgi:hypothetical protein